MKVKSSELRTQESCSVRRMHDGITLENEKPQVYLLVSIVKDILLDALFEKGDFAPKNGVAVDIDAVVRQRLADGFEALEYLNEKQKELKMEEEADRILRYLSWETRPLTMAKSKTLDIYGIDVEVNPDVISISEDGIEVIKFKDSKPDKIKDGTLELYSMLRYAESLVPKGNTANVTASYYCLGRDDDKTNDFKAVFTEMDAKGKGIGGNIIQMNDTYTEGVVSDLDKSMEPLFDKYFKGDLVEDADCSHCEFYNICHYKEAPKYIVKTRRTRSISDMMDGLTKDQDAAVNFRKGIARINAGAGAGKTLVIALRAAILLYNGVKPEELCLLTFTNAGAAEMKERIKLYTDDLGIKADLTKLVCTTFNSFCYEEDKKNYQKLGFTEEPQVLDDIERTALIANLLKGTNLDGADYKNFDCSLPNCRGVLTVVSHAFDLIKKNGFNAGDEEALKEALGNDMKFISITALPELIKLSNRYNADLCKANLVDFSDQEALFFDLLSMDPLYAEHFGFKHIIIDEFQDSDKKQVDLIKQLIDTSTFESLMVVGDDSQAIFSFRDVTPEYIINFEKYMGKPVTDFYLLENHRSQQEIIDLANRVNALNQNRVIKDLKATRPAGEKPIVRGCYKKEDEMDYIAKEIKKKIDSGTKPEDIAFIAGDRYALQDVGDALSKLDIPWVSLNPEKYIENSRVLACIALNRAMNDPRDTEDILTYLNCLYGNKLFDGRTDEDIACLIEGTAAEFSLLPYEEKQEEFHKRAEELDQDDEIYQKFLEKIKRKKTFETESKYIHDFQLYGKDEGERRTRDYSGVVLSTAHSSKGLEWPVVFLSISKFHKAGFNPRERDTLEEKRRLLFVSMTRARDELVITGQYVACGSKAKGYTYNWFLKELYDLVGQEFVPTDPMEKEHREIRKKEVEEAAKLRREKRKKELEARNLIAS